MRRQTRSISSRPARAFMTTSTRNSLVPLQGNGSGNCGVSFTVVHNRWSSWRGDVAYLPVIDVQATSYLVERGGSCGNFEIPGSLHLCGVLQRRTSAVVIRR